MNEITNERTKERKNEKDKRMSILKITQDDINRSKPPAAGWHLFSVEKFAEDDSKDKKSKNYVFECVVIGDGPNKGRYCFSRFNSKAMGMLVSSGFLPSVLDKEVSQDLEFDPDQLLGKEFWGEVKDRTYEGKLLKEFGAYSPASKVPF